jgi:hypothetical protein
LSRIGCYYEKKKIQNLTGPKQKYARRPRKDWTRRWIKGPKDLINDQADMKRRNEWKLNQGMRPDFTGGEVWRKVKLVVESWGEDQS